MAGILVQIPVCPHCEATNARYRELGLAFLFNEPMWGEDCYRCVLCGTKYGTLGEAKMRELGRRTAEMRERAFLDLWLGPDADPPQIVHSERG